MKVKVTLDLELPETYRHFRTAELRQVIFDEVQRAAVNGHNDAAMAALTSLDVDELVTETAVKYHRQWAEILKNAKLGVK